MRVVLRVIATLLLLVGVPLAWVATATADAPTQAGWWWKLGAGEAPEAPVPPVPAPAPVEVTATKPPTVPEGGLLVANDPSGPAAVAAVQLPAAEGETGTLTLTIADGGTGEPLIVACPATGVWTAEEGGAIDDAPKPDCSVGKIVGEATEEAVTFALDTSVATVGGGYDLVLLPDPDSGTPFQTPFEAPEDAWAPAGDGESPESVEFEISDDELAASGSDSSSESLGTGSGSVDSGSGAGSADFSTDFGAGDAGSLDTSTPPVEAAAPGEAPGAPSTATGEEPVAAPAQTVADDDTGAERITAIGLLVLLAAALFWVSSRQGLASSGTAAAAGVGRFARPRTGRPNGLT